MGKMNFIKRIANIIFKSKLNLLKIKITPKKFYSKDLNINKHNSILQGEKVEKILDKYKSDPKKLIEYIKGANTPIYIAKNPDKFLSKIKQNQGFIMPQKGFYALYLNLILNKKISFKTSEMFVIDKDFSSYLFVYEFYKWYSYKTGVKGYEIETQDKYNNLSSTNYENLTFDEIIELKTAIKRDIEAIEFVKNYSQKHNQSLKVFGKIKQGKAANI